MATTFGASRMHRATPVMEHNIHTCLVFFGGMISCMAFATLRHTIGMIVDPSSKGKIKHGSNILEDVCLNKMMVAEVAVQLWME